MNGKTVKSTARLVTSLAHRAAAQNTGSRIKCVLSVWAALCGLTLCAESLSELTPAYRFKFDGDCKAANGEILWGGQTTIDAALYKNTRNGTSKALKLTASSAPWSSNFSVNNSDFTVLCSARTAPKANGALWTVGHYGYGSIALAVQGDAKVGLVNWNVNKAYPKDNTATTLWSAATHFHTYAVVYHMAKHTADFYVDGQFVATAVDMRLSDYANPGFQIGGVYGNGDDACRATNSLMDDWRLYGAALTAEQIAEYAAEFPVLPVGADKTWVGANYAAWSAADNWSPAGVPGSDDCVDIPAGSEIWTTGHMSLNSLVITGDGDVRLRATGQKNWHKFQPASVARTGSGRLVLISWYDNDNSRSAVGLESRSNTPMFVNVPFATDDITAGGPKTNQDVWLQGNDDSAVVYMLDSVTVDTGYVFCYKNVVLRGDVVVKTRLQTNATTTFAGTLSIGDAATVNLSADTKITGTLLLGEGESIVAGQGKLNLNSSAETLSEGTLEMEENSQFRIAQGAAFGNVKFAEGAKLYLQISDESATAATIAGVALPEGGDIADYVVAVPADGSRKTGTVAYDTSTGVVTATLSAAITDPVRTIWVGGTSTDWSNNTNWTLGAPAAADTAVFNCDATINRSTNFDLAAIEINNGATLFFNRTSGDPETHLNAINGNGNLAIMHGGLTGYTEDLVVAKDITIDYRPYTTDSWMKENNGHAIIVHGSIDASKAQFIAYSGLKQVDGDFIIGENKNNYISCGVTFNGRVVVENGAPFTVNNTSTFNGDVFVHEGSTMTIKAGNCQFNGNTTIDGTLANNANDTTFVADKTLSGTGTVNLPYRATINSDIVGALTINLTGWSANSAGYTDLAGNNANFSGTLNSRDYHIVRLGSINSGSPNATWNIATDCRYVGTQSGTLKFGALNLSKVNWSYFYLTKGLGLVLEVGHLNTDMTWGSGYCFGTYDSGTTAASTSEFFDGVIRKVGTGTLETYADHYNNIEFKEGVVSFKDNHGANTSFTWTGGTARFDTAYSWDPSPRFDCANSTVIEIDTAGNDFTWGTALTGNVGITKRGEGVLALTGAHTYTGNTTVLGGTLVLPLNTSVGTATVAEGAELAVDGSSLAVSENTPYVIFSGTVDGQSLAGINVLGSDWNWTVSAAGGAISATATAWGDIPNVWIGGASGNWTDAANWSRNIKPQPSHTIKFESDATVAMTESVKDYEKLVLDNASVTIARSTGGDKFHLGAIEGTGRLTIDRMGLGQINGRTLEIPATVEMKMKNNSWFGDFEYGGIVNVRGNVAVSEELQLWKSVAIYGNISGTGSIVMKNGGGTYGFYGDNRDFHGTIEKNFNTGLTIGSANAAGTNIAWRVGGDMTLDVSEGVVQFGSLELWQNAWCVMYFPDGATTTLEVGNLNTDFAFNNGYFLWGNGSNRQNIDITIRKVGTGTLTSYLYNYRNMEIEGGKVVLNNPSGLDSNSFKNLNKVSVGRGAVLACNIDTGSDGMTIDSLEFKDGSYYQLALSSGNVVQVSPAALGFEGDVYMLLSSADAANAANSQIFASTVTGHPMKSVLTGIDGELAPCGGEGYYWTATYGNDGVWLYSAEVAAAKVETGDSSVTVLDADLAAWLAAGDATDKVNAANDNGVTGILAYMLGAEDYTNAAKPTMGATVADGVATLTFDDSAFRRVPGLKLAYYLESCDKADFSEAVTTSEPSDKPAVPLEFANAKIFNRLCADVRASE